MYFFFSFAFIASLLDSVTPALITQNHILKKNTIKQTRLSRDESAFSQESVSEYWELKNSVILLLLSFTLVSC